MLAVIRACLTAIVLTLTPADRSMIPQIQAVYLAEKRGDVQLCVDAFESQRRYMEAYCRGVTMFSSGM